MKLSLFKGFGRSLTLATVLYVISPLGLIAADSVSCVDTNAMQALHEKLVKLNPPEAPIPGAPINRMALLGYLETEGKKLVDNNATLTEWKEGLGARTCNLKLPSASTRTLSAQKLIHREESAVGVIGTFFLCGKCSHLHIATASGFFINESGAFATCRHVLENSIENGRGIVVITRDGKIHAVTGILACDPLNDLLVLQVAGNKFTPLPLCSEARIGTSVSIMSHPEEHFYTFTTGVVSEYFALNQTEGKRVTMAVTAEFAKGSSGGPVCNAAGAVVGMVNNTESIYYSVENGQQKNFQMTFKNCTPTDALLSIVKKR